MPTHRLCGLLLHLIAFGTAMPATADPLKLQLPLDCDFARRCQIQNLFDHDPGPGFTDYACGRLGYDGHKGVDLRLPNLAVMREGVAVVAAAPGRVRATRDAMPDVSIREIGGAAIKGHEAGNSVVIRHGEDWETQYSHLRRGSVRVKPGDTMQAGQILGLVGLSGNTEFPHLHFEVRYRGKSVDPFVGLHHDARCGIGDEPLWDEPALRALEYNATGLLQAGFAPVAPRPGAIEAGEYSSTQLAGDAPALSFWVEIFGARAGDRTSLQLLAPDGSVLAEKRATLVMDKARWVAYVGKKRRRDAWPQGIFRGRFQLLRERGGAPESVIDIERELMVR